jgi:hypothetical protein
VAQDADQQRDLQPHHHPDREHQRIERDAEILDDRKQQKQPGGRPASQRGYQNLHPDEYAQLVTADVAESQLPTPMANR